MFVKQLPPSATNAVEGQTLHLEAQVKPTGDNSMVVEWYRGDQLVPTGKLN